MPRSIEISSFNRAHILWAPAKISSSPGSRNVSGYMGLGGIIRLDLGILTLHHPDWFIHKPGTWILAL